ncbi:MAG TPA: phospholipid carrier-dependent glycosyltransferase [Candidatus Binatia bacterium]|nr:phospholipid carrier-dependent glycosyltransferase [Candidatus Binatia bacterium]
MEDRFSILLFRTGLVGCLLGIVATIYFLLGLAGYVGSSLLNLFVAGSLIATTAFCCKAFIGAFRETNWVGRLIGLCIFVILIAEILLSLVPPTARDELTHHLAIPRLYAREGRIIEVPMAPYSYYPMLLDMLYTPWVYWGQDSIPKLIHGLFAFLTGLSLYAYLSRRMNGVYGLLGFFFFISVPSVLRLSHWAYVDLGVTFYATASLLSLLRWSEEKSSTQWLFLAALAAGFAVATKPNGFVAWLLLFFLTVWVSARETEKEFGRVFSQCLLFAVVGALPFLPWLAKNWFQTGNPFFPFLAGFFPTKTGVTGGSAIYVSLGIFAKRELLYGESWWQIVALPLRLFFFGRDDDPQYFDGVLGPSLILLLPFAFKGKWIEEKKLLMAFALLFLFYALFLVDLRARYVLPIVPPLVVLLTHSVFNIYLRIKHPVYLFALLLLFAAFNGYYLWRYLEDARPLGYLTGQESRAAYLTRALPEYPAFQYINGQLSPAAKIYLLFVGRRGYYCERDYFHDGGELPGFLLGAIRSAKEPAAIARQFKTKHLTHLLVRDELLLRFLSDNLDPAQQRLWDAFVAQHLKNLFRARGYSVLQLYG